MELILLLFLISNFLYDGDYCPCQEDSLLTEVHKAAKSDDIDKFLRLSLELRSSASSPKAKMEGALHSAFAYGLKMEKDSSEMYFSEAFSIAEKEEDLCGMAAVYNYKGLVELNAYADCYRAMDSFSKGLEVARECPESQIYSILLANMAYSSSLKNDPDGICYAEECYERGKDSGNEFLMYIGAYTVALFRYGGSDNSGALKYIQIAENIAESDESGKISDIDKVAMYNLYGKILLAGGRYEESAVYLDKAIDIGERSTAPCDMPNVYMSYGNYYMSSGKPGRALEMYWRGIEASFEIGDRMHLYRLYGALSAAYEKAGNIEQALVYHKKFHDEAVDMFNLDKERTLSELKVKYELLQKENEIKDQKDRIKDQKRRILFLCLLSGIIAASALSLIYFYRKRNLYYLSIVKSTQESLKARESLYVAQKQINESAQDRKYSASSLSDGKGYDLFIRIEKMMKEGNIYRDRELTVTRLAEAVESNRSYVSHVINRYSGRNFNSYVNKYRIDEAIRMLSYPDGNIPLKTMAFDLGFISLATFYSCFKKEIGLPPYQYREKLISLNRSSITGEPDS